MRSFGLTRKQMKDDYSGDREGFRRLFIGGCVLTVVLVVIIMFVNWV